MAAAPSLVSRAKTVSATDLQPACTVPATRSFQGCAKTGREANAGRNEPLGVCRSRGFSDTPERPLAGTC
jgi:hypothetical protein